MRILAALTLMLALAIPAGAYDCVPNGPTHEADIPTPAGRVYVDNVFCQPDCVIGLWIYQESNGIEGLQRGDFMVDDTCGGQIPADTRLAFVYAAPPVL